MSKLKKIWSENSLGIVLFGVFVATVVGMSVAGWQADNNELINKKLPTQSYTQYVTSGDFVEGVFENWESEFLQMFGLVVLTIFLRQKGADDSKPLRGKIAQDTVSRYRLAGARTWSARGKVIAHGLYAHSLSLALAAFFVLSFTLHAVGGAQMYNEEAEYYHQPTVTAFGYMATSQFWYESLQNWQSEFFAVGMLLILSIKLRERGSPESKPVGKRYDTVTGS